MPAITEEIEIDKYSDYPVENWGVGERKEAPYRKEPERPVIWGFTSRGDQSADAEDVLRKLKADSKAILECHDDSDSGFVPYTQGTLDRAIDFLTPYIRWAATGFGTSIPTPKLLPGPSGGIDVHWKNENKELVVNIPADSNAKALFYGDDYGEVFIKGSLGAGPLHPSVLWWLLNS
jgi:hypothetical protein